MIVDMDVAHGMLTFLTRGSRAVFKRSLMDVSLDPAFINALDVRQACYVGLKVAEWLQYQSSPLTTQQEKQASHAKVSKVAQYVTFDRQGHIVYVDPDTECLMSHPAMDVAKDDSLLQKFSPDIAYAIGLFVGRRLYHGQAPNALNGNVVPFRA